MPPSMFGKPATVSGRQTSTERRTCRPVGSLLPFDLKLDRMSEKGPFPPPRPLPAFEFRSVSRFASPAFPRQSQDPTVRAVAEVDLAPGGDRERGVVVGEIQADQTVKGGTGRGAELARHFRKPLYFFDQVRNAASSGRTARDLERVRRLSRGRASAARAGATSSRRKAITELFDRSFESR